MKGLILFVVCMAAVSLGQTAAPLQVVKTKASGHWESDGTPKALSIEVLNASDKEVAIAEYRITWRDKLGRTTDQKTTEPVLVHEPGHKTLRVGKKGTQYFDWNLLHPHDEFTVEVVTVKFVDGTLWEAAGTTDKN